ncbi:bacterial alpha-L-rhamnosidase-domain-containing protein [Fusarium redolens]|uniref:alpha-L-rhamnosidase n=1 Tax=Fusarium redolens TaxID=48865 RepID=A0A9P9KBK7_FUSRE|nr:bacterial alpha-L-rhamnosidase-domain-containing protein [Fusarium redolens]KAH7255163.1 bacterial alpha-L-rhamnosidase-domain-containing protein [Fusarium redolens]
MSTPQVFKIKFEHHHNGLGVDTSRPRLSWAFETSPSTASSWVQTCYEVEVTFPSTGDTQVFTIESEESVLVPWPARRLSSRESASVRVRVYGKILDQESTSLEPSPWSAAATVEAALLETSDFNANFITSADRVGPYGPLRPIRFYKEFTLPQDTTTSPRARLYITSLGVFEATINGKRVGDEVLAPGWTSYNHRLIYRIHDVTSLLIPGNKNVISVEVAEGWYAGRLGFKGGKRFRYGDELGLLAQLEIQNAAGKVSWGLLSDDSWSCTTSPIVTSEIYDGEVYDMNHIPLDVLKTSILPDPSAQLMAPDIPPVRVTETISCKHVFSSQSSKTILDFGQNLVGKLFIPSLPTEKDKRIIFRHAEVMENGELGTRPLRDAKCCDTIIGSGEILSDWSPKFTFHGFRYVEVKGWPGDGPSPDAIQAVVLHTDMERRGFFECSNPYVNQLHKNIVWSMRGNFLSLPTDCPQRDERLGWTGDLQVFCPTATYLYDTLGILSNWLQDVSAEQLEEGKGGIPPLVCPNAISSNWPHMAQAIWDDVTVLAPDALFQYSSDKDLLERQFESIAPDGLWNPDNAPPEDPGNGRTDNILVANAYLVHTTLVFSKICSVLGKAELARRYAQDGDRLKALFQRRYITAEGNLMSTSQTGLGLAIRFGLYPENEEQRKTAGKALDRLVRTARFHISTGFAGTPVISHALSDIGRSHWLYAVRWDSMLPDGRINPGQMTSFNHYALGAVGDWLHGTVGVRPIPGGNITSAKVSFNGPCGLVACEWNLEGQRFTMSLTIPPNCSALVTLPSEVRRDFTCKEEPTRVLSSGHHSLECQFDAGEWPPKPMVAANQPMPVDSIAG